MDEEEVSIVGNKGFQGWHRAGFVHDVQASGVPLSTGRQMWGSKDIHLGPSHKPGLPVPSGSTWHLLGSGLCKCLVPFSTAPQSALLNPSSLRLSWGRHFEAMELEGGDPEPGDLFLFRLMSPTRRWCRGPHRHVLRPRRVSTSRVSASS